jgi:hypothetical protein
MKILGLVLAVLMLLGSAAVSVLGARKANHFKDQLSELTAGMSADQLAAISKEADIPSTGRMGAGAIVGFLSAATALALLVVAFAKKKAVPLLAVLAIAAVGLSALLYPHIDTGPLDGLAPRMQAFVAGVLTLIGAGGAMLAAKKA